MSNQVAVPGVAYARINWGRLIANCPGAWCDGADDITPDQRTFRCPACGLQADLTVPANLDDLARILALRPARKLMNWEPHESLMDLVEQNLVLGIAPSPAELEGHHGPLLVVIDDRIVSGHRALGAG